MEIVPTLDAMHYFAHATEDLLRPQKIDIGQYGLMGRSSRICVSAAWRNRHYFAVEFSARDTRG